MSPVVGVVVFDYASWISQYPEFAPNPPITPGATSQQAQSLFDRITIGGMVDNTPSSIITDLSQRTVLLNLAVAHFAYLAGSLNSSQKQVVGRISSATQGSVSASFEFASKGGANAAFWNQSPYGAQFYAMTLSFRTAFYVPPVVAMPMIPGGAGYYRRRC